MEKLTVYFDGLCRLCSKEIDHYKKLSGAEKIRFVDITSSEFNASAEGVDPKKVHEVMHVKTSDGRLQTEVAAFIEIWKVLPQYQWLVGIAEHKLVSPVLGLAYRFFASTIRPLIPKKAADCSESPFCQIPDSKSKPATGKK